MRNTISQLQKLIIKGNCPHAIMLTGNNIDLVHEGNSFAKWALCGNVKNTFACGNCHICHLLHANTSPDFMQITPSKSGNSKTVKIEQVRSLRKFVQFKPQFSKVKIAILCEAEYLNMQAANALLKVLEEPPSAVYIILTVTEPKLLIDTIISRCAIFDLGLGSNDNVFNKQLIEHVVLGLYNALIMHDIDLVTTVEQWMQYETHELLACFWWLITQFIYFRFQLIVNIDLDQNKIAKISASQNLPQFWAILDKVIEVRKNILSGTQVNIQLFFEELMISWEQSLPYVKSY